MNAKVTFTALTILLLAFMPLSFAANQPLPGVPHQFWGKAMINNAAAPDGTSVTATVNGAPMGSATTSGGQYNLMVTDPSNVNTGKTIILYVSGVQAGTSIFANGKSTQMDLAITVATPSASQTSSSSSGGGGGGSGGSSESSAQPQTTATTVNSGTTTPSGPCQEKWTCDAWSTCASGLQKRNCNDANKCGTTYDLPLMSQPCGTEKATASSAESPKVSQASSASPGLITGLVTSIASPAGVGIMAIALIAGYGFYSYSRNGRNKR